jgi:hypothetical protein
MASFVPRYCKKHLALKRREAELIDKLANGVVGPKLLAAADEVRAARIRALKERLAKLPPYDGPNVVQYHKIEDQIRRASLVTAQEILSEFQKRVKK